MKKIVYEQLKETLYVLKLKNGMIVHLLPKVDETYTTYVQCSFPFGALHLQYIYDNKTYDLPPGIAHFLEHKIFAMPDGDAFHHFSKLGVDANAMTSRTMTGYIFNATEHLYPALTHLLNMLDVPYFTEENVAQEKMIIAEELKMYLDDPQSVMYNHLLENMYHHHPMKHEIGGTIKTIQDVTPSLLTQVYNHFYGPSQRLLVIAGKMDLKAMQRFFKQYDQQPKPTLKPKLVFPKEPKPVVKRYEVVEQDVQMNKLMIGIKLDPSTKPEAEKARQEAALTLALNLLLGPSSPKIEEWIKNNWMNRNFSYQTTFVDKAENIVIYAESKNIYRLKKALVTYLTDEFQSYLTQEAFERYQKTFLGQYIFALNNLETKTYLHSRAQLQKRSLFEMIEVVQSLTLNDLFIAIDRIKKHRMAILIYKKTKASSFLLNNDRSE